jgi:hypothetical protein
MAIQRRINFVGAMHEMRAERRSVVNVLRGPNGSWNKAGIMREAIRMARMLGRSCGLSWREKLSISLRTAWKKARKSGLPFALKAA